MSGVAHVVGRRRTRVPVLLTPLYLLLRYALHQSFVDLINHQHRRTPSKADFTMPRAAPYPSSIISLISSTSYPPLPSLNDLDALRQALAEQRGQKRKRDDELAHGSNARERAVLESNEKAGRGLDAAERHRLGSVKASPGPGLAKVKKERSGQFLPLLVMVWVGG